MVFLFRNRCLCVFVCFCVFVYKQIKTIDLFILCPNYYEYESVKSGLKNKYKETKNFFITRFNKFTHCFFLIKNKKIALIQCGQRYSEILHFMSILEYKNKKNYIVLFGICGANKDLEVGTIFFTKKYTVFKNITLGKEPRRHQKGAFVFNNFYFSEKTSYKRSLACEFITNKLICCFEENFNCAIGKNICTDMFINDYDFCIKTNKNKNKNVCFNTEDGFIMELLQQKYNSKKFFPVRVVSDHAGMFTHEIDINGKQKACDVLKKISIPIVDYFAELIY